MSTKLIETPEERKARLAQIARQNGAHSQGPKTAAGKAISSRNRLSHGLYAAKHLVIGDESADDFDACRQDLYRQLQPRSAAEERIVEEIAAAWWRQSRVSRLEAEIFQSKEREGKSASWTYVSFSNQISALARQYGVLDRTIAGALRRLQSLRALAELDANDPITASAPEKGESEETNPAAASPDLPTCEEENRETNPLEVAPHSNFDHDSGHDEPTPEEVAPASSRHIRTPGNSTPSVPDGEQLESDGTNPETGLSRKERRAQERKLRRKGRPLTAAAS